MYARHRGDRSGMIFTALVFVRRMAVTMNFYATITLIKSLDSTRRRFRPSMDPQSPSGRDNNFNLLRILAAGAVLVSHAYPISLGPGTPEPLYHTLGMTLGTLAVLTFFAISGYFISRSFHSRSSVLDFVVARMLNLLLAFSGH